MNRLLAGGLLAAFLIAGTAAIGPTPALALCAGAGAETVAAWSADPQTAVFVGKAVETRSDGYSALFEVSEGLS